MRTESRIRAAALCLWTAIAAQADHTLQRPGRFEAEGAGFVARSTRVGVRIDPDGFALTSASARPLEFRWMGSNGARLTGAMPSGVASRFPSSDPTGWRSGIQLYGEVKATAIYPEIDAIYYFHGPALEFDLILHPGSELNALRLSPPHGSRFEVTPEGSVTVRGTSRSYVLRNPQTWQMRDGRRIAVNCTYFVAPDGSLRFKADRYDRSLDLTIDPLVEAMTYLGGGGIDRVQAAAVDSDGNLVLAGITDSANFPGTDTRDARSLSIFVVKLNRAGSQLIFATTLGLRQNYSSLTPSNWVNSIVAAPDGTIYVAGYWSGSAFPTKRGAWQTYSAGGFLTRLDSAGSVIYSTMVGAPEWGLSVTRVRERDGVAYLAGSASRPEFYGTSNAFQRSLAGFNDFYVIAIDPAGAAPIFVTALGGAGNDILYDMSLAADGSILVAGTSSSKDFPGDSGEGGVVARLDATGSRLLSASGFRAQAIYGLALLPGGDLAIAGPSPSTEWMESVQRTAIRFPDLRNTGFVARLSGDSFATQWITELTVAGPSTGRALSADEDGNLYWIDMTSWPSGGSLPGDRYSLYKLSGDGSRMLYAGPLRGSTQQAPIAEQAGAGRMLVAGGTAATDLPVSAEAVQPLRDPGPPGSTQTPLNWEDAWAGIIDLSAFLEGNFFAIAPSTTLTWRAGEPVSSSVLSIPVMLSGNPGPLTASTSDRFVASYTASPAPTLRVTPNPGHTIAGRFRETVTLRGANPEAVLNLPVELTVRQRISFELASSSVEARMREGQQQAPPTLVDIISDFGTESFIFDVRSSNPEWLSGSVLPVSRDRYQLRIGLQAVKAGVYEGTLTIGLNGIENAKRTLRVQLTVDPPARLRLSSNTIRLHVVKGQPVPTSSLTVYSDVPGLRWGPFIGIARTWLKVDQSSTVTPGEMRVSVDPATVEVGYFQFKASVSGDGAAEPLEVAIIVDVASGAALDATPAAIERLYTRGGSNLNSSVEICFTSPAATAVEWSTDQPWALPRQSSGTTPYCSSVWFDDSIKEGVYKGVLTARAGAATVRVPLTWTLCDQPKLIYSASPLRFTWPMGSPPPEPQKLTFTTGTIQQEFVSLSTNQVPDWLKFNPPYAQTPATILVSPILEGRGPGTYTTEIVVWGSRGYTGNSRIPVTLEILEDPKQAPSKIAGAINLASRLPGAVAPGELVVIQGTDLGPPGRIAAEPDRGGRFPTSISGRTFYFDDVAAPILSLSDKDAVVAVPYALAGRSRTSLTIEVGGKRSAPHALTVVRSAPGVFTADGLGSGVAAAGVERDGGPVAAPASAPRGGILVVFATGLGALTPSAPDGALMSATPSISNALVRALIGGREATVLSASTAPGLVSGVVRIEVRVPEAAPAGSSPLLLLAGDDVAQPGVTVVVQ